MKINFYILVFLIVFGGKAVAVSGSGSTATLIPVTPSTTDPKQQWFTNSTGLIYNVAQV